MRALYVTEWGQAPVLREVSIPARDPGYSLIRMEAATVSHLDATIATGKFVVHPVRPYIPGVEGAGVVVESDTWPSGERVVVRGAGVGVVQGGSWCEVAHVPDEAVMSMPAGMDFALAACFFVPSTTAFIALHDVCTVTPDSVVQVTGARGAVGSLAVQLGLDAGCTVVAITRDPEQWTGRRSSDLIVCAPEEDVRSRLGRPTDCLIDTVGGPELADRLQSVRPGGTCALVGYASNPHATLAIPDLIFGDVTLVPVNMLRREQRAREVASGLADQLVSGALYLRVDQYPLDEVQRAIAAVSSGTLGGRAVLRVGGSASDRTEAR